MKRRLFVAGLLIALVVGCHGSKDSNPGTTTLTSAEAPFKVPVAAAAPDIAALVSKVSPSVVNITATQELRMPNGGDADPFDLLFGRQGSQKDRHDGVVRRRGLGSGFILDDVGHVVTNAHVIEDATRVKVTLSDERELDAKVKGRDDRLDLAVLELQDAKNLPRVALGHSEELRVGDYVVVMGNPFGLGNTVTTGIISAKGRALGAGPYDDFIQTDASINPGNSGGPLFDLEGEVVGISTAINPAGQGIGFAIPIDALREILPQLLDKGVVSRGKLGVAVQTVDATLGKAFNLDKPNGALVSDVEPGSAAVKAGIKPGDIVIEVDGTPVVHAHDLPRLVARKPPGARVTLEVANRNAPVRKVQATLDELVDDEEPGREEQPMTIVPPPGGSGRDFGLDLGDDPKHGVVVRKVEPTSRAAESLQPDDVVLEVNSMPAGNAREAKARIRQTRNDRPLLLKVQRRDQALFVAIDRR